MIQEHTKPSKTLRQEELSSDEQPPVLPEGQYYIEKLLAQRKRVYMHSDCVIKYSEIYHVSVGFNHRVLCLVERISSGILFMGAGF